MLGICNGFQVLLEAGLLPGAMLRNRGLKFHCEHVARPRRADRHAVHRPRARRARCCGCRSRTARATTSRRPTCSTSSKRTGRSSSATRRGRRGRPTRRTRTARSHDIAGICNEARNVVGLMPHPERACEAPLGSADGLRDVRVGGRSRSPTAARCSAACDAMQRPIDRRHGARTARPQARRVRRASCALLGREPNLTELGIFSVMWSEHCSYKSSRVHLRTLPTEGPQVLQGPGENAGAVDIGDGLAAVFKIESHNHPSFIEPYQGAATGVGGIIRDIFTMGARPIALLELAAVRRRSTTPRHAPHRSKASSPASPATATASASRPSAARSCSSRVVRRQPARQRVLPRHRAGIDDIIKGVRRGVGNAGLLRRREDRPRRHPRRDDGVGGVRREVGREAARRAGRRSVHGEAAARGVPRGDADRRARRHPGHGRRRPDLLDDARWDRAAAPASRSTSSLVPQRETGMTPYEIMLSESQERMLLVVKQGREAEVERIFEKWDLHAVRIGEVTDDGLLRVQGPRRRSSPRCPNRALTDEAPVYHRPMARRRRTSTRLQRSISTALGAAGRAPNDALLALLGVADHREQALGLPAVRPHGADQHDRARRAWAPASCASRARRARWRCRSTATAATATSTRARRDARGGRGRAQRRVRRRACRSAPPTA